MDAAEKLAAEAVELLNNRQYGEAVQRYMLCLQADPKLEETWLGLGLAITLSGRFKDLPGLADFRQRSQGDGFRLFYNVLVTLMTYQLYDHVLELERVIGTSSTYAPALLYQAGCVLLLRGDEAGAFERFGVFKDKVRGREDLPIGPESPFNIAYRQGTLIEDPAYVAALDESALPADLPAIEFAETIRSGMSDHLLAAACDARYFLRYAEGFVGSVAVCQPGATIHLHVAHWTPDCADLFERFRKAHPELALNISLEAPSLYASGAYFASMRFLVLPRLMERYRRKILLLDIDILLERSLDEISLALDTHDFVCFRHDGAGPCSRYPAVLTGFAPAAGGMFIGSLLGRFVGSKLDVPWPYNWMLDQAALSSVLYYLKTRLPETNTALLNDLLGRSYRDWLTPITDEAKEMLIRSAGT